MTTVLMPPAELRWPPETPSVFLAGSIEMGAAAEWQAEVASRLNDLDVVLLNPRREAWDSSWVQDISNADFRGQVCWELDALERATVIAMHLDPATKAPVSLLELGLFARSGRLVVSCPEGYWRRGNVQVVCARYNVKLVASLDALIGEVRGLL